MPYQHLDGCEEDCGDTCRTDPDHERDVWLANFEDFS